jgi:hypothetical protein
LELVTSITAPLYWIIREKKRYCRNGSAFFLDMGAGTFAVTANHVIEGWRRDCARTNAVALQLGSDLPIDLNGKHAIIAAGFGEVDLAWDLTLIPVNARNRNLR